MPRPVFPHTPTSAHRGACHRKAKDGICTRPAVHTLGSRPKCVGWCRAWHHIPSPQRSHDKTIAARWYHPTVSVAVSAPRRPQRQAWQDNMTNWPKNEHTRPPHLPWADMPEAVGPKEVQSTSRRTTWSGQLDLPQTPTLAHRGICHRQGRGQRAASRPGQ